MREKKALVLGSSGFIGSQLLQLLLNDPAYSKVIALVRKPLEIKHPKLEEKITDFSIEENYKEQITEGDDIFCCIGTTMKQVRGDKVKYRQIDYDIPVHAARWGLEKGYTRYTLVSAIGADAQSSNFYLCLKGEVENSIAALPYRAVHIFQPSLLLGNRQESRPAEKAAQLLSPLLSLLTFGKMKKYSPIQGNTVAKSMLAAAGSEVTGVHYYTFADIKALAS